MYLLISYSGVLGGAERVLIECADALGADCCVACPPGRLADALRARRLRVLPLRPRRLEARGGITRPLAAALRLAAHGLETRALVDALDPQLVIAWGMRSGLAAWIARLRDRAPVVFQHNDFLPGPLIGAFVRRAAAATDVVVTPSEAVARDLDPDRRLDRRLVVVHPGIDVDSFAGSDKAPADPPEVLVLGALVEWKRPDLALDALALARARRSELRMRFVGTPIVDTGAGLLERIRERASQPDLAGAVELAGAVTDVRAALERASCLLHCAPREPFGLVLLEALAAARPVVAPASAGPLEILDATCGILYPPGDAAAAGRALLELVEHPERAAALGSAGRSRARAAFSLADTRKRFADAVEPIARRRPSSSSARSLALVTVTRDSASELELLLESVARHLRGARVVIVDCASGDRTLDVARDNRPGITVELLALEHNVGFGTGCNRGLRMVDEPVAALINPDVELIDNSVLLLAEEVARADGPERLLAPLVLSPDGSRQDTVHPLPSSPADLAQALIPPALASPLALGLGLAPWRSRRPRRVGWAVGCALVARTDTFIRLGPFDEQIFLYGEDLDLGLRARTAGIETWFWPRARVLHARAHASTREFGGEPFDLLARARHEVIARRLGERRAQIDDRAQAATFASRLLVKRALGRNAGRERRRLDAIRSMRLAR